MIRMQAIVAQNFHRQRTKSQGKLRHANAKLKHLYEDKSDPRWIRASLKLIKKSKNTGR